VPVIGSDAAGIPYLVRQGENGLVVTGDNTLELEKRLRELPGEPDLRRRIGSNRYEFAYKQLKEQVYIERFTEMIRRPSGAIE